MTSQMQSSSSLFGQHFPLMEASPIYHLTNKYHLKIAAWNFKKIYFCNFYGDFFFKKNIVFKTIKDMFYWYL